MCMGKTIMSKRVRKHVHDVEQHKELLYLGKNDSDPSCVLHTMTKRYCFHFDSDSNAVVFLSKQDSALLQFHLARSKPTPCRLPLQKRQRRCSEVVVAATDDTSDTLKTTTTAATDDTNITSSPAKMDIPLACNQIIARPPHRVHIFYLPKHYPMCSQEQDRAEAMIVRPIHIWQLIQQLRGEAPGDGSGGRCMRDLLGIC